MYGMINTAIRDLVVSRFGAATWERVRDKAGVTDDIFSNMVKYPDEATYKLVGAASEVLETPAPAILEAFGEYWTVYSAESTFGHLLDFAGNNLVDFLSNLDHMHARVALSFPALDPPSFKVTDVTDRSLRLHYYSRRDGLAPLAAGMVKGLATRFSTPVKITLEKAKADGHDHDEFAVLFGAAAA